MLHNFENSELISDQKVWDGRQNDE